MASASHEIVSFVVSKVTSENVDIVGVYRSQDGDLRHLAKILGSMIDDTKTTVIGGDLNICALKAPNNIFAQTLKERGFEQVVTMATHIMGGLLDHVYINPSENKKMTWVIDIFPKYYSDHDGIGLTLWTENQDKGKQLYFN